MLLLVGCASKATPSCAPDRPTPGAEDVCFLTSDGWSIHGAAWNRNATDAPLVILAHGLNEDHHSYDVLGAQLAARGWRVLAFDSRGQGASTHAPGGQTRTLRDFSAADLPGFAADLDAARRFAGEPRAWIGASIGANLALRIAAPTNESVVLLSPGIDYQGITTTAANAQHHGAALMLASRDDATATNSVQQLSRAHQPPPTVQIWDAKGHGTNMLDDETRALIVSWLDASR